MKYIAKIFAFLLATVMLTGCGGAVEPTETTILPPPDPIVTHEALVTALENNGRVVLEGDIAVTTGVEVNGHLLDGAGYQVTAPTYNEEDPETYCGVFICKGVVENIVIKGGHRGIGTGKNHRAVGDLRLNNVVAEGENSALYVGEGDVSGKLFAMNCSFYGQTVFNRIEKATFENCTFGFNDSGSRGRLWAYTDTTLIGCRFENDGATKFTLGCPKSVDSKVVVVTDCYVGDTLITPDNIGRLLKVTPNKNTIVVINTTN